MVKGLFIYVRKQVFSKVDCKTGRAVPGFEETGNCTVENVQKKITLWYSKTALSLKQSYSSNLNVDIQVKMTLVK